MDNQIKLIEEFASIDKMHQSFVDDIYDDLVDAEDGATIENFIGRLEEIAKNGCASGTVLGLIYFEDTDAFFNEYYDDIYDFLESMDDDTLNWLVDRIKEDSDAIDVLMGTKYAKNDLVWFVYDSMAQQLLERLNDIYE